MCSPLMSDWTNAGRRRKKRVGSVPARYSIKFEFPSASLSSEPKAELVFPGK
jgi:hypothetical protein